MKRSRGRGYRRSVTKGGRGSNPKKVAWLHTLPCLVTEKGRTYSACDGPIEAHHHRPMGARASDARTVPLCAWHHRTGIHGLERMGRKGFQTYHSLDLDAECLRYDALYTESNG